MDRTIFNEIMGNLGFDIVMAHTDAQNNVVTLLRLGDQAEYAVCRVHPSLEVATAPRFEGETEHGTLSAATTRHGMKDLLDWTDRATALARYESMVGGAPRSDARAFLRRVAVP